MMVMIIKHILETITILSHKQITCCNMNLKQMQPNSHAQTLELDYTIIFLEYGKFNAAFTFQVTLCRCLRPKIHARH